MAQIRKRSSIVPGENKNRKKLPVWAKLLIGSILTIAVAVIGAFVFINVELNRIGHPKDFDIVPPSKEYFEADVAENTAGTSNEIQAETSSPSAASVESNIIWPKDGDVLQDKGTVNILLIGQDRRPGETRARSDSMMIGTINKKNKTIKITSLMRDMYVQIPGYSDNRINAAYAFGGMKLLDSTIEKNFQVHMDGNIEVDFDRFKQIIDKLGGIDIPINAQEVHYLTKTGFKGLSEGWVHMDGALALEYCSIRDVGNADYERTERQKRVVTTVFNNIKGLGLPKILALVNEIFPLVTTDLSNGQIISLATSTIMMETADLGTYRIPIDGAFNPSRIRGMSVLVPDLTANRNALKDIISGN